MASAQKGARPLFPLGRAGRWLWRDVTLCGSTIWQSYVRFARQRHLLYAAAISYYGIISLVPLLAIGLSIGGWLLRSPEASAAFGKVLSEILPVRSETIVSATRKVSAASLWAFVIYLFGLLWAGAYLFESVERVINAVCNEATDRAYHVRKFFGMAAAMAAGVLLLVSVGLGAAWAAMSHTVSLPAAEWVHLGRLIKRAAILLPLLTSTVMFTLVYRLLPRRRIAWRAAFAGGLYAGLFWEFSKWAFGLFVIFAGREYGTLYGSLANVVIIMLWIHVSAIILILGAHTTCIVQERKNPS